jgi:hypothetical protein
VVHLPAALISPEVRPPAWMGPPAEVFRSGAGGRADAATDWLGTALRFAAGPEPAPGPARKSVTQSVPEPAREPVAQYVPEPAREQQPERLPSRDR